MIRTVLGLLAVSGVGALGTYTMASRSGPSAGTVETVPAGVADPTTALQASANSLFGQVPVPYPPSGVVPTGTPTPGGPVTTTAPGRQPIYEPGTGVSSSSSSEEGGTTVLVGPNGSRPRTYTPNSAPTTPRKGNGWREHEAREHEHRDHEWREHEWREHEWRERERREREMREHEWRERERREHARLERERKDSERREHQRQEHERQHQQHQQHAQDHAPQQQQAPEHHSSGHRR
jgi:hypothetical protein